MGGVSPAPGPAKPSGIVELGRCAPKPLLELDPENTPELGPALGDPPRGVASVSGPVPNDTPVPLEADDDPRPAPFADPGNWSVAVFDELDDPTEEFADAPNEPPVRLLFDTKPVLPTPANI